MIGMMRDIRVSILRLGLGEKGMRECENVNICRYAAVRRENKRKHETYDEKRHFRKKP